MRRAGSVTRIAQGLLVLRSDGSDHPDIGAQVIDESLDDVGRVVDVFGPVDRPYLAVSPAEDVHPPSLIGATVYLR
ncbi:MAG: H/ACA ribonucleoprotein complex subunit GAR1 [Halanaeroarchaeum sp.]